MFESISISIELVKQSFEVLRKDREMLLYPVAAGISVLLLFALLFIPVIFLIIAAFPASPVAAYLVLAGFIAFAFTSYFLVIYFNAGLVASASIRLSGRNPSFMDGIRIASKNAKKLFIWAIINGTVGIVISSLERSRGLARIVAGMLDIGWNLATFLIIPVILFEKQGSLGSIRRSGLLFRKTWGENIVGRVSLGIIFGLLFVIGIIPIFLSAFSGSLAAFASVAALVMIYWLFLLIAYSCLNGIYVAMLYSYARSGKMPAPFDAETVRKSFRSKY